MNDLGLTLQVFIGECSREACGWRSHFLHAESLALWAAVQHAVRVHDVAAPQEPSRDQQNPRGA